MTAGLTGPQLDAMRLRDEATADGMALPDYECAADRHALLAEVARLQSLLDRAMSGRPTAG